MKNMDEGSLLCEKHDVSYSLKARIFSVFFFVMLVVLWCLVFWPLNGGVGLSWMLESWWGLILFVVWVSSGLITWLKFSSGRNKKKLLSFFVGLCLTSAGVQLSQLFSGFEAGSFAYSVVSFLMLAGEGLVFFWVLAPVDSSGCDCSG